MPARKRKASKQTKDSDMFKGASISKKKKAASESGPSASETMFAELADSDDPTVMGMEGKAQQWFIYVSKIRI
jgi:hypothetical protein